MDQDRGLKEELIKIEKGVHDLLVNNKRIGSFIIDVDGYYYFWMDPKLSGSWNSNALRLIADKMDMLNKDMD